MNDSENGLKIKLSDSTFGNGVAVWIKVRSGPDMTRFARVNSEHGYLEWEEVPRHSVIEGCTLLVDDEIARGLLEELLRYYQGASDMHTVRADLLHERERVDKLIGMYADLAEKAIDS
jgi:hypothetical protein